MRSRIRSQTRVKQLPGIWTYYDPSGTRTRVDTGIAIAENGCYNHLIDTTQKRPFNSTLPCEHVRNSITTRGIQGKFATSAGYMIVDWPGGRGFADWPQPPYPSSTSINGAHIEAINFFASGCQDKEVSLGNFLWELGEVADLVRGLAKAYDKVRDERSRADFLFGDRMPKNVANSYLTWIFGVAPVLRDVTAMVETLQGIDKHIQWLIDNSGRPTPVRFTKDLSRSVSLSNSVITDASNWFYKWRSYRASYVAHAVIQYDVKGLSASVIKTRSLLRAFGAMNPLQAIWQGVGLSFMVDWVWNVSSLLENLEIPILLPYRIIHCGHSLTVEAELMGQWSSAPVSLGNPIVDAQHLRWRHYSRKAGIPVSLYNLPDLTVPGLKQLVSAIAIWMSR